MLVGPSGAFAAVQGSRRPRGAFARRADAWRRACLDGPQQAGGLGGFLWISKDNSVEESPIRGHSELWSKLSKRTWVQHLDDGCLEERRDSGALVLWIGCDGTVGGGDGCSLPLQELQDGLNVRCHLRLQSDDRETGKKDKTGLVSFNLTGMFQKTSFDISA